MPKNIILKNQKELILFYKKLLDSELADGIVVPVKNSAGRTVQALVMNPEDLERSDTFSDTIPVQSARILKNLTFTSHSRKLAVVCKPCEVKAVVELTKFKQINKENLLILCTDCVGTYEMTEIPEEGKPYTDRHRSGSTDAMPGHSFRKACSICNVPTVSLDTADGVIGFIGMPGQEILISFNDDSALSGLFKDVQDVDTADRDKLISGIREKRTEQRESGLKAWEEISGSLEKIQELLAPCIRCHNCMVACPICYCRECVFRSPTFEHTSESIIGWAERKGSLRMLENTLLFHLTRLNHMASSCIGCGLCSSACPNGIDVATLFIDAAEKVQKMLNYEAGRSYSEAAPVTTFKEDELTEETHTYKK